MKYPMIKLCSLSLLIFCLFTSAHAQVKGSITIKLIEGGGNGAAYGFAGIIGPTNRTQSFTCPRTSLGDIPTGRTSCSTTYGSSVSSEWQPGDKLRFFTFTSSSTDLPFNLRTGDLVRCAWEFKGLQLIPHQRSRSNLQKRVENILKVRNLCGSIFWRNLNQLRINRRRFQKQSL